jgi:hypothetical protein
MPCASDEVRGLWWDQRCPTDTDALQIATEALLDAADHMVGTGLAGAGYTVLAMPSCPLLQLPSHREAIAHYFAERGLSLIFAPVVEDDPGASLLSDILFFGADRTLHGAAARAVDQHDEARAAAGQGPAAASAPGSCAQIYLRKLARLSGLGGWNDPRTHLPAHPHLATARLNLSQTELATEPARPLAIGPPIDIVATELRSHFALACVRAAPLILSTPPHRLSRDARRIVTDKVRANTGGGGICDSESKGGDTGGGGRCRLSRHPPTHPPAHPHASLSSLPLPATRAPLFTSLPTTHMRYPNLHLPLPHHLTSPSHTPSTPSHIPNPSPF